LGASTRCGIGRAEVDYYGEEDSTTRRVRRSDWVFQDASKNCGAGSGGGEQIFDVWKEGGRRRLWAKYLFKVCADCARAGVRLGAGLLRKNTKKCVKSWIEADADVAETLIFASFTGSARCTPAEPQKLDNRCAGERTTGVYPAGRGA